MYEKYYGLKEKPFNLTPDPEFLFENEHFRGAFDNIIYGIKRLEGFTTIVGDVGTGKTTLCWALLGRLDKSVRTALILNPLLTEEDMLKAILQDFGIRPRRQGPKPDASDPALPYDPSWMQGMTKKELIDELNFFLLDGAEKNVFNILIIDEAQNLSPALLEQLRILSNLETAKKKLLQIIFVGQLEFEKKLHLPELRQLNQRITIRYALKPLSRKDMLQYIEHRLSVAGSRRSVGFSRGALRCIYSYSKGYPRLINIICDRSLLAGYSERTRVITPRIVRKAARVLHGSEGAVRVRFAFPARVMIPILALVVLTLIALFAWKWRGSLPALGVSAATASPLQATAGALRFPVIEPAEVSYAAPKRAPSPLPAPPDFKPAATVVLRTMGPLPGSDPATAGDRYILQIHSLKTRDNADDALAQLQSNGFPGFVKLLETADGRSWYVVYAGPYDALPRAREDAAALGRRWTEAAASRR